MYIWQIGWRYLVFRPICWVLVAGVSLGMTAIFVVDSVMNGFIHEQRHVIRGRTSDIVITPVEIPEHKATFETVDAALEGMEGVVGLSPRLHRPMIFRTTTKHYRWSALNSSQLGKFSFLQVIGIDVESETRVCDLDTYLRQTSLEDARVPNPASPFDIDWSRVPDDYRNVRDLIPILLGERIYEYFALSPYSVMKMVTYPDDADPENLEPISALFLVVGAFKTDDYKFDLSSAMIPRSAMKQFLDTDQEAHEIAVAIDKGADLDVMKRRIQKRLNENRLAADVLTWVDRERTMLDAVTNERAILNVILFFLLLLAIFFITASLWTMVSDKTRDIGILSSLGAAPGGLGTLFLTCGMIICVSGTAIGLLIGYLVTVNVNAIRIFIEETFGIHVFKPDVYVFSELPAKIDPDRILLFVIVMFFFSFFASAVPSLRAGLLDPVRCLRHE